MKSCCETCAELRAVARAMLEWIDAVPKDTVLPAMPGFDRDWADMVIDDQWTKEGQNENAD